MHATGQCSVQPDIEAGRTTTMPAMAPLERPPRGVAGTLCCVSLPSVAVVTAGIVHFNSVSALPVNASCLDLFDQASPAVTQQHTPAIRLKCI